MIWSVLQEMFLLLFPPLSLKGVWTSKASCCTGVQFVTGLENHTVLRYCRLEKTLMIRFQMFALMLPFRGDSCVLTQLWQWTQMVVCTVSVTSPHVRFTLTQWRYHFDRVITQIHTHLILTTKISLKLLLSYSYNHDLTFNQPRR